MCFKRNSWNVYVVDELKMLIRQQIHGFKRNSRDVLFINVLKDTHLLLRSGLKRNSRHVFDVTKVRLLPFFEPYKKA